MIGEREAARQSKRKWMTRPTLSVIVAVGWLLLQQSLALPQLITALVLGLVLPRLIDGFLGPVVRPSAPRHAWRLFANVIWDIVESNLTVARIVLNPFSNPTPSWLHVPMEVRNPVAQTLLASIITNTPGTVSCQIDEDLHVIVVHVLDCNDPAAMVAHIKQRYELPLKEILG